MKTLVVVFQSMVPKDCAAALGALARRGIPFRESEIGRGIRYPRRKLRLWVEAEQEAAAREALRHIPTEFAPGVTTTVDDLPDPTAAVLLKRFVFAVLFVIAAAVLILVVNQ